MSTVKFYLSPRQTGKSNHVKILCLDDVENTLIVVQKQSRFDRFKNITNNITSVRNIENFICGKSFKTIIFDECYPTKSVLKYLIPQCEKILIFTTMLQLYPKNLYNLVKNNKLTDSNIETIVNYHSLVCGKKFKKTDFIKLIDEIDNFILTDNSVELIDWVKDGYVPSNYGNEHKNKLNKFQYDLEFKNEWLIEDNDYFTHERIYF
jgi:hypothetical protein